ncbi:hypothetical protein [Streptomyces sp. NPDC005799]
MQRDEAEALLMRAFLADLRAVYTTDAAEGVVTPTARRGTGC